jgi:hypothetical protein
MLAAAGAVLAGVALAWVAGPDAAAGYSTHSLLHIGCKHHAHCGSNWRDEQVKRLAERYRSAATSDGGDHRLSSRAVTAGRTGEH